MGRARTTPSKALGQFLKAKRAELGMTVRQAASRLGREGYPIPVSSLGLIESGRQEPGAARLHRLLRMYGVPAHVVGDLIEMEDLAAGPPKQRDLESLHHEGIAAWKAGDIGKGLAHLFAVRDLSLTSEMSQEARQKALLNFSVAAAEIGRLRLAREIVGDLLCEPPHDSIVVRVLVHAATVWSRLGSAAAGMAFVREAEAHLGRGRSEEHAWTSHQKARILHLLGDRRNAAIHLKKAIATYRALGDHHGECTGRMLAITLAEDVPDVRKALRLAIDGERFARKYGHAAIAASAGIRVGRLLAAIGELEKGIARLHEALGRASALGDPHGQFLAHFHLWKCYERKNDTQRARFERQAAAHFVTFVDEDSPETREARQVAAGQEDDHA